MAVIGGTAVTLTDLAKDLAPDNSLATVIELLNNSHEIVEDMPWMEGNLPTGHMITQRTSIPQGSWRLINQGVPITKATEAQVTETCAMLEDYARVDRKLVELSGNPAQFRLMKAKPHLEGMTQQFASTMFYGSVIGNPASFTGLSARYFSVNKSTDVKADNVLDAGGTGSTNTSLWLIGWGDDTISGIYPRGTTAGLQHEDVTTAAPVTDASGNLYQVYQDKFSWGCGVQVSDWRYVVRIANIDVSALSGGTPPNLYRLMVRAMNRIPNLKGARFAWYGNRAVKTWADIQAMEKGTMAFQTLQNAQGELFTAFRGIPFRLCDQILNTEARVV